MATVPLNEPSSRRRLGLGAILGVCLMFAAAVGPSLGRLDFFDGVEHFNLATVQEMRRNEADGRAVNWMLPTLQNQPRIVKPPLAAWITSLLVMPTDATAISTPDDIKRQQAISHLTVLGRLPTLVCACLMLLGIYVLGSALTDGDWRIGATAALICAGTILFFIQGRRATTDLQLALWVTWTNACLALVVYRQRIWLGSIGAGIALGLASMAKGPHIALLMTLVPFGIALLIVGRGRSGADSATHVPSTRRPRLLPAILVGALLAILIGGWWYAYVFKTVPDIAEIWRREVLRKDAQIGRNKMDADPWYAYVAFFGLLLPWTVWVLLGAYWVIRDVSRSPAARRMILAIAWTVMPLLVMSFFSERKVRYLLPFVAPAAVIAGWAIIRWWDLRRSVESGAAKKSLDYRIGFLAGWITLASVAFLILYVTIAGALGAKGYQTAEGGPWFSMEHAALLIAASACILFIGVRRSKTALAAPLLAITLVAWLAGETRLNGQAAAAGDPDDRPQRQLAAEIWHRWPDANVYSADPVTQYGQLNLPAIVLSMNLNRVIEPRPATLPASPQAKPMVLITDAIGDPPPVPNGWTRFAAIPLRKGARYVDVLEKK
jgi:4-amino-4-deoxy-L-arabinose transferase-like glycosyltransferase